MNIVGKIIQRNQQLPLYYGLRFLLRRSSLGLDEFSQHQLNYKRQLPAIDHDKFYERMRKNTYGEAHEMVFTDDLKVMVYTLKNTDEEIKLFSDMLIRFNSQNVSLRFGKFTFGPVVMRMLHSFNRPVEALDLYNNSKLDGFFDQLITHVVLLDLLFENQMFNEMIEVYKTMREKQLRFGKYPKSVLLMVYAALFKMNTPKSYDYMTQLWNEMKNVGSIPLRRVVFYASALAIKQAQPDIALEMLNNIGNQNYYLVRSLKVLALCSLNKLEDALVILASVLAVETPQPMVHTFPKDVILAVEQLVEKSSKKDIHLEFKRIHKQLIIFKQIKDETLDECLCANVEVTNVVNAQQRVMRASFFNEEQIKHTNRQKMRPGLEDMI